MCPGNASQASHGGFFEFCCFFSIVCLEVWKALVRTLIHVCSQNLAKDFIIESKNWKYKLFLTHVMLLAEYQG